MNYPKRTKDISELITGFKKLRDVLEFGPYFGGEATSAVIEADKILDKYRETGAFKLAEAERGKKPLQIKSAGA
jgi:hypothetical protein